MLRHFVLLTIILSGVMSNAQESAEIPQYGIEQFLKTVTVNGGFFNADETKLLISSNETGVFNAYVIDLRTGEMRAVTNSTTDSITAVAFFPADDRILYTRDRGGSGITHLFLINVDGSARELTQGDEVQEQFLGFADGGKSFFTLSTERNLKKLDLCRWDVETLQKEIFFRNDEGFLVIAVSPDGRRVALERLNTTNDTDIYLKEIGSEAPAERITQHSGELRFHAASFSRDGKYLYYRTNQDAEFLYVKRYEIASGRHEEYCKKSWDIDFIRFSPTGRYRAININADGASQIDITDMTTGREIALPDLPYGMVNSIAFSPSERLLRLTVLSDKAPANIFVFDIGANEMRRLTDTLNPEIYANDLVTGELVRFKARDGLEIPGFLYKPKDASAENKVPVLLWLHDGPRGQNRPFYNAALQFLVNHGYGVFAINQRGSLGYGRTFFAADDFKHGREPLWDCVDAKGYLESLDWVAGGKIGLIGNSIGGYMVLAGLAFEPEQFAVGIDLFGVNNLMHTLLNFPKYWEYQRQAFYLEYGDPQMDEENLTAISPLFSADKIKKPLFVVHGANDPFVSRADVDKMVAAVKANGVDVEFMLFEDEGFNFSKNENIAKAYNAILKFLNKHLKGAS